MSITEAAILDTETTGTFTQDVVIELAYLPFPPLEQCSTPLIGTPVTEFNQRYSTPIPIHPEAFKVHGISKADLAGKPAARTMGEHLEPIIGSPEKYIYWIGHRIDFDLRMVQQTTGTLFPNVRLICAHSLAVRLLTPEEKEQLPNTKLISVAKLLFPEYIADIEKESHSALGDCSIVLMVLSEFLKRASAVSWEDLWRIANAGKKEKKPAKASEPQLLECWPNFGQHKGQLFEEIPERYLIWARDNLQFTRPGGKDLLFTINHWISKGAK